MIDNTIFCLFPKIDFDLLKNIKIIPNFTGAWRQPFNYLFSQALQFMVCVVV